MFAQWENNIQIHSYHVLYYNGKFQANVSYFDKTFMINWYEYSHVDVHPLIRSFRIVAVGFNI